MKRKVLVVFGTRPEAIKMAPVVHELNKRDHQFEVAVCVTAQHRQMLDQVLRLFGITPEYDLDIMTNGQDLYDVSCRVLSGMKDILRAFRPDVILVHGDTTTSTFAALAAFYEKIPVGHVEAGLRTYDKYSPWPEEMNRQLTGRIATYHFAPTAWSRSNLLSEGIPGASIWVTGNTVVDALLHVADKIEQEDDTSRSMIYELEQVGIRQHMVNSWKKKERRLVLITGHRRENFGEGFRDICYAIRELAVKFPDTDFVYPVHMNPNVRQPVEEILGIVNEPSETRINNIFLVEPLGYLPFVGMMKMATVLLTDSGGIQEEALSIGKPVLVMRKTTERPEALKAGTVRLVGTDRKLIIDSVEEHLLDERAAQVQDSPYGNGDAAHQIVTHLYQALNV